MAVPHRRHSQLERGQLRHLLADYVRTRDPRLRAELLAQYEGLVGALARRFHGAGDDTEDLRQQARIGLLKALERFDPSRNVEFTTFAWVTICGELKRHARDRSWRVRVPRRLQERHLAARTAVDDLRLELGREPSLAEISTRCDVSKPDLAESLALDSAHHPSSLDAARAAVGDCVGVAEDGFQRVEDRDVIDGLLQELPRREQRMLRLRFISGLSQAEIGEEFGISQVQVSRIISRAVARLRRMAYDVAA